MSAKKPAKPAKAPKPRGSAAKPAASASKPPAKPSGSPVAGRAGTAAVVVIVVCGLLVLGHNAGLLPRHWADRLVLHRRSTTRLTPASPAQAKVRPTPRGARRPAALAPEATPVAAATPPAPAPEPAPAPPAPKAAAPVAQPAARPKPTPPANPGVLTPEERRARLLDAAPPDGFTSEWAGGPAILKLDANELARGRADHRRVALTFDGCYDASTVPAMLELLRAQHVRVTFFLTGIFARQFPAAVRQIAAAGHEIGNHSYDHPYFTRGSDAADLRQVERAEQLLSPLAGSAYRPYFRPPYGDRNLRVLRLLLRQGYLPVYWTVDTLDWQKEATPETVLAKVEAKGLRPGSIILMHVGSRASLRALPQLLTRLRAAGLEPGPLAGVLAR